MLFQARHASEFHRGSSELTMDVHDFSNEIRRILNSASKYQTVNCTWTHFIIKFNFDNHFALKTIFPKRIFDLKLMAFLSVHRENSFLKIVKNGPSDQIL